MATRILTINSNGTDISQVISNGVTVFRKGSWAFNVYITSNTWLDGTNIGQFRWSTSFYVRASISVSLPVSITFYANCQGNGSYGTSSNWIPITISAGSKAANSSIYTVSTTSPTSSSSNGTTVFVSYAGFEGAYTSLSGSTIIFSGVYGN